MEKIKLFSMFSGYGLEIFSHQVIFRAKRFYKRDNGGYYYIPEIHNLQLKNEGMKDVRT